VHPLVAYALENVAAIPMRVAVAVPVAIILLATVGGGAVSHSATSWAMFVLALFGGWLLTLLANLIVGTLALFMESSVKVMDIYLAAYFVMSGYLIPVELFPGFLRKVIDVLPFRYQIGLPVELMTGAYDATPGVAATLLLRQWLMVALFVTLAALAWRRGIRRFGAYGG
jgi:ABC-2 type transport system permease protein